MKYQLKGIDSPVWADTDWFLTTDQVYSPELLACEYQCILDSIRPDDFHLLVTYVQGQTIRNNFSREWANECLTDPESLRDFRIRPLRNTSNPYHYAIASSNEEDLVLFKLKCL